MESSERIFHLFNRLPAELRIEIWKMAIPQRVIEVNHPQWLANEMHCHGQQTDYSATWATHQFNW